MAHAEWDRTAMRQLAADLRRFTEAVRGYDCSRIKRLAADLDLEAAEMEASNARRLYNQKAGTNPICLALGHAQPDLSAMRSGSGAGRKASLWMRLTNRSIRCTNGAQCEGQLCSLSFREP